MISSSDILHGKVLIVDDLAANILLLERMLRGAGYVSVTTTSDPTKVYELHLKHNYDLILLDLQMPGMDGFQVMENLKKIETGSYLPVLVITAQPNHKLRALKMGAKDFVSKPFDIAEVLLRAYNMIEVRLLNKEVKSLYDRVVAEQKVSDRLLLNVLPVAITERLKNRQELTADRRASSRSSTFWHGDYFSEIIADSFKEATVLFADIVEFTMLAEAVSPEVLVGILNEIFTSFDSIADQHGLEKIKTSGDAYMAAAGLPIPMKDHAFRAAHMALDMMEAIEHFNEHSPYKLKMRIGIDTGSVVAGVIGTKKFIYDLWGDTVNTASRMESHGMPGRIQITNSTKQLLIDSFTLEERGIIDVKSKGKMRTWFLNGTSKPRVQPDKPDEHPK
jgi:adenylate cyclase